MTNTELIAEARQWAPCAMSPGWQLKLITKLANALEAAEARIAELEAAARVPVQGEPNDVPELVDVVLTTADIEQLAHLLVQLSPATQKNSGATVRRLMQEMNIKEVEQ